MYVLKVVGSTPEIYWGIINGFYEKVETLNQALQLNRNSDAIALQSIIDGTEVVNIS